MNSKTKKGFTLLEVLAVVIIIGILSALGFANMNELIQTNKAKEASRTLTAFVERALAESNMRKEVVIISVTASSMQVHKKEDNTLLLSQDLLDGYSVNGSSKPTQCAGVFAQNSVETQVRIGTSGIDGEGCFVVCNTTKTYCGAAVKTNDKNTFTAYIKRKDSKDWEAL